MGKNLLIIVSVVVVFAVLGWFFLRVNLVTEDQLRPPGDSRTLRDIEFTDEVVGTLDEKLHYLEELTQNRFLIVAAESANVLNAELTDEEITVLDTRWRETNVSEMTDDMRYFFTNNAASQLNEFQRQHPEFVEIFMTDKYGLNIAQTNKTTDYYQADEAWWVQTYYNGDGKAYVGAKEFDESAGLESIPLYTPVYSDRGEVIGIIKAVFAVQALPNARQSRDPLVR